ncbi:MAG: tetratricopeptide repeat protein, partial [Desulfovibrio sp.]|nr:tetratricopeptide repeat protein [Desulfovibrio sp.]
MASEFTLTGRARLLVAALGLGLAAMLVASLAERFTSTGLTVRHAAPPSAEAPAGATDEVGRLMQEVARDPGNKAALVEIAERLMSMGSWDGAESFATRALALDPQDARTRYLLGVIRHNQGK